MWPLLIVCLVMSVPAFGAVPVNYRLARDGRVSVAVYDKDGVLVRTLLNAAPQTKGRHTIEWDGLDAAGKPAPPGKYKWRLLTSQGLTTKYLLSLGTSSGYEHWIAQHGGPACVAVDEQGLVAGASPEGSPMLAKVGFDGKYLWNCPDFRAASGPADLTIDGGRLYVLLEGAGLYVLNAADGKRLRSCDLTMPVRKLDPIPETNRSTTVTVDLPNGRYLVRMKVQGAGKLDCTVQDRSFSFDDLKPGRTTTLLAPQLYRWPRPVEVKDGKLMITFSNTVAYAVTEMEVLATATRIDARAGALVASFPAAQTLAWLSGTGILPVKSESDHGQDGRATIGETVPHVLHRVEVPGVEDVSLVNADEAFVAAGDKILRVHRDGRVAPVITTGLQRAYRLSFDPSTGVLWVADDGRQQVLKFVDKKLVAAFGREGGRRNGLYQPEDFRAISDIVADGHGGFIITEWLSAPRRTARFDGDGKLLREWYGGQQFYTFAAPEPGNPRLVWMDSQWGWLMQVEVDYEKRDWKVRACYPWAEHLDKFWIGTGKMASRMFPIKRSNETLLWFENNPGLLLRVDEAGGALLPVAMLGNNKGANLTNDLPAVWADALEKAQPGLSEKRDRRGWTGFAWADANNDGAMQGDELRLLSPAVHKNGHGFGVWGGARALDDQLNLYTTARWGPHKGMWVKYPAQGYTAQGWPIWDWSKGESGPQADGMDSLYLLKDGSVLTLHRGGGDKYTARDTYAPGHGWQWPANGTDGAALCRWDAQGHKLWQVGTKAARREAGPGRLHYPIRISGELPGFVAVCDKIVKPCEFWSDDGLYVGGLLDKRVEDALPARLYVWWQAGKDDFDPQLGRAALQYDMILGGSLVPWAKDEALFLGAGWNNVPVFKITGFDKIERQHDSITLRGEPPRARGTGTGPRLWFEPSRKGFEQPVGNWTGFVEPLFNEAYTFAVYAVGQAKVSLDGKLIIDGTAAKAKGLWKQFSAPVHLQAGAKVPFAVEFQGSELHVCWESLTQSIEHVPATALYPAADR